MVQQVSQNSRNALSNLLVRVNLNHNNKRKIPIDLLSLEPGCSEEDKVTQSIIPTTKSSATPDDDNIILLYELEGGLFGQQSYDASYVEYIKQGSNLRNITNLPKVLSAERNAKTEDTFHSMPASMDADDYLWSN